MKFSSCLNGSNDIKKNIYNEIENYNKMLQKEKWNEKKINVWTFSNNWKEFSISLRLIFMVTQGSFKASSYQPF